MSYVSKKTVKSKYFYRVVYRTFVQIRKKISTSGKIPFALIRLFSDINEKKKKKDPNYNMLLN